MDLGAFLAQMASPGVLERPQCLFGLQKWCQGNLGESLGEDSGGIWHFFGTSEHPFSEDVEHFFRTKIAHGSFHHSPRAGGGKKYRVFRSEDTLQLWLYGPV